MKEGEGLRVVGQRGTRRFGVTPSVGVDWVTVVSRCFLSSLSFALAFRLPASAVYSVSVLFFIAPAPSTTKTDGLHAVVAFGCCA